MFEELINKNRKIAAFMGWQWKAEPSMLGIKTV
jgi:hypothetical protein